MPDDGGVSLKEYIDREVELLREGVLREIAARHELYELYHKHWDELKDQIDDLMQWRANLMGRLVIAAVVEAVIVASAAALVAHMLK